MDNEQIINKVIAMFGDEVVDPEVFPKRARYQFILAKFELEVEARNALAVTEDAVVDPPKDTDVPPEETPDEDSDSE